MRSEARVLGIDPGGTTGWSLGEGEKVLRSGETNGLVFVDHTLHSLLRQAERVVIERFQIRSLTPEAQETVELIGAIRSHVRRLGLPLGQVSPDAKKKTLERATEAVAGGHARDAEAVRLWDLYWGDWQ